MSHTHKRPSRLIAHAGLVALILLVPLVAAEPIGEHQTSTEHARLSLTDERYEWHHVNHLQGFTLVASEPTTDDLCFRFENIHATQQIHQPYLWTYDILDADGAIVFHHRHWQAEADSLAPGASRTRCWFGEVDERYAGNETWLAFDGVPPGAYSVRWPYWDDAGFRHAIELGFEIADDSGVYGLGTGP